MDSEEKLTVRILPLRYGVAVPRMSIDGVHYWLVLARFSNYQEAQQYTRVTGWANVKILDIV